MNVVSNRSVAVIGAGWAGLSAAVRLQQAGFACTIFEAARVAGGRARRVEWTLADGRTLALDNGQHILIGAYRETLALCAELGIVEETAFERTPFRLVASSGFELRAPHWPAPWHLLAAIVSARGLSMRDRLALLAFMHRARRLGWALASDCSVAALLQAWKQPATLIRALWAPLCIAALNTPLANASAQVFLNVLRDSLAATRSASDLLIPRVDLGALLPDAALARLCGHVQVRLGTRVQTIELTTDGVTIASGPSASELAHQRFDAAVLAVPATEAARLIAPLAARDASFERLLGDCSRFAFQPIVTAYLAYRTAPFWRATMMALADDPSRACYGQWAFDRSDRLRTATSPQEARESRNEAANKLLAVVISADGPHRELSQAALLDALAAQLATQLGMSRRPLAAHLITEKRATFACVPSLGRPESATPHPRLVIAGDYTASHDQLRHYPATLETAVTSGREAARVVVARLSKG